MSEKTYGDDDTKTSEKILEINNFKKTEDGEVIQKKTIKKVKVNNSYEDEHNQVMICEHALHEIFEENDYFRFEFSKESAIRKNVEKILKQTIKSMAAIQQVHAIELIKIKQEYMQKVEQLQLEIKELKAKNSN